MEPRSHFGRVLRDLSDPAAYPHPVDAVRVAQTHISAVFLTGEYAYKVKKPVDFGFLDYRTLELRERYARKEVELNARLCSEVYLDVLPVTEVSGRLRIGGAGRLVDWALRMRQLPEPEMLPARLEAGTVDAADVRRIARVLAEFHGNAASGPAIAEFGGLDTIRENVAQSFPVPPVPEALVPATQFDAIRAYVDRFQIDRAELLLERRAGGWIREGHGDLRLQNICLAPGIGSGAARGVQIFDCIEFNDRFRFLDVASDLAYLAMDLDLAGRADLRHALVREYREAGGHPGAEELFRFYYCFRACVRGKIALLAAAEEEVPPHEREGHRITGAAAYDLAAAYAAGASRPRLVVVTGLSGSGKSVLARELARRLPAITLSSDRVRKELAGVAPTERLPEPAYAPERVAAVYAELQKRAAAWLASSEHVVLDATFGTRRERELAKDLAGQVGAAFRLIDCRCPDGVIRGRLEQRRDAGTDPSDAGIAVYEAQLRSREPVVPEEAAPGELLQADTSGSAATTVRSLLPGILA